MATKTHRWLCANGHSFLFGTEQWHDEVNQGYLSDGAPIPSYCTEVFEDSDEPCMDSTSLIDTGSE